MTMTDTNLLKKIYDSKSRSAHSHILKEEELALIKDQSYAKGLNEGRLATKREVDEQNSLRQKELENAMLVAINQCSKQQTENITEITNLTVQLGISLFRKTFENTAQQFADKEIEGFINNHLQPLKELPSLRVRVHPDQQDTVHELFKKLKAEIQEQIEISVTTDKSFELTDCYISWEKGYVERKLQSLLDGVSKLVFSIKAKIIEDKDNG